MTPSRFDNLSKMFAFFSSILYNHIHEDNDKKANMESHLPAFRPGFPGGLRLRQSVRCRLLSLRQFC